jgi:hypothetical protein
MKSTYPPQDTKSIRFLIWDFDEGYRNPTSHIRNRLLFYNQFVHNIGYQLIANAIKVYTVGGQNA